MSAAGASTEPSWAVGAGRLVRRYAQMALGLAISAWSIWQLSHTVDLGAVRERLEQANLLLLTVCLLSISFSMVVKSVRWRYLFAARSSPGVSPLLSSLYIGYLMNTVLPARVGEFVRAFLVGRHYSGGTSGALATIVLEKLLDLSTLALLLIGLIMVTQLPDWVVPIAHTSVVALVLGFISLGVMLAARKAVVRGLLALEAHWPLLRSLGISGLATSFLEGLAGLGRRETLPGLLFWSITVWASAAFTLWAGMAGVGIPVGLPAVLLTLVVTNIGMAVPSAPGYVGVFHGLVVLSLRPFGVDPSHALGAALVIHAVIFGNFIIGGLWFLWRGGYNLGALRSASGH